MNFTDEIINKAAEKYKFIFKSGYLPNQEINVFSDETIKKANCIAYAMSNLTNPMLDNFTIPEQKLIFKEYFLKNGLVKTSNLIGLSAKLCQKDEVPDRLSWKVGYYFSDRDIHLIKQQSEILSFQKRGWEKNIEVVFGIPEEIKGRSNNYKLCSTYILTNPNGKILSKAEIKEIEKQLSKF